VADGFRDREHGVAGLLDTGQAVGRRRTHEPDSATATPSADGMAAVAAARPARRPAMNATMSEVAMMTAPTTSEVSSQNANGKSWTRRSVVGSNRYDPAGKKISWKTLNSWSQATSRTHPRSSVHTD